MEEHRCGVMRSISEMRLARLCFAPSVGQQIDAEGWTTVFTLGGLTLPDTTTDRDDYSYEQRLLGFGICLRHNHDRSLLLSATGAPGAFRQTTEHQFPEPTLQKNPQEDLKRSNSNSAWRCPDMAGSIARRESRGSRSTRRPGLSQARRSCLDAPEPPADTSNAVSPAGVGHEIAALILALVYGRLPRWRN